MAKSSASIKVTKRSVTTKTKTQYKIPKSNKGKGNPNKCPLCGKFTEKA